LNGLKHGDGEFKWADGSYYKGSFFKGMKHGQGDLYRQVAGGEKWIHYTGAFQNDYRQG
jgi:hypothetical protein